MLFSNFAPIDAANIAAAVASDPITIERLEHWSLITQNSDGQASAKDFTADAGTDELTAASAHGLQTGQIVQVSTTTTLPDPLAVTTDYYVIVVDTTKFKLATTLANALAGTEIDITDAGTGTHTETPATWGVALKVQYANRKDKRYLVEADWFDMASGSLTLDSGATPANKSLSDANVGYAWIRLVLTITGGGGSLTVHFHAKGPH